MYICTDIHYVLEFCLHLGGWMPEPNDPQYADDVLNCTLSKEICCVLIQILLDFVCCKLICFILIQISLEFVPKCLTDNNGLALYKW